MWQRVTRRKNPGERAPPTTRRNAPMKQQHIRLSIAAALAAMCAPAAHAVDVTAGDWKLSFDGNVNTHYIYSSCAAANTAASVAGGLSCIGSLHAPKGAPLGRNWVVAPPPD